MVEAVNAIELKNITKRFGEKVIANDSVNLTVRKGEILSLLGENGSGKTTLMNMLSGIYIPDSGEILIEGSPVTFHSPADSIRLGIGMIHQHFKLVDVMTAKDNIVIGQKTSFFTKGKALSKKVKALSDQYGLDIDPDKKVYEMSVGEKQTLEIIKVLYRGAKILILDEPTAGLDVVARETILDLLRSYLMEVLGGTASLPPRRGRPAKPFYSRPVLSSTAVEKPAPHPAPGTQLPFAGGNNFRELGGYPADEGKHVRWGQIYRGIPTGLLTSDADRKLLDSLGLRLILDLRSEQEAEKMPDYVPDGARMVRICGLCLNDGKEVDFSPEDRERLLEGKPDEGRRMADAMYRQMLFGNKAYKELFRALEVGETPVLFHCSGGKDRTGVAAMLILLALGASDETIRQDFVRTNECRRPELEKIWAEHADEIAARPEQKKFYQGIAGVHPESVYLVLSAIREKCGSAEAYLEAEYGLTPARLMRLRRMYLE